MATDKVTQELLVILNEECSEVQKCISKFLRFGAESHYLKTNSIEQEVGDVLAIITLLCTQGVLDSALVEQFAEDKHWKLSNPETTNLQCYAELV